MSDHLIITHDADPSLNLGEGSVGASEQEPLDTSPPPSKSPLDGLKHKLAAARDSLHRDIEVPRFPALGLRVFVRYGILDPSYAIKINIEAERKRGDDWQAQAAAVKLAHCCLGVYATDLNDTSDKWSLKPDEPAAPWTKFDHHLAVTLGVIDSPDEYLKTDSVEVCQALYFTEGDLMAALNELADWSSLSSVEADRDFPAP